MNGLPKGQMLQLFFAGVAWHMWPSEGSPNIPFDDLNCHHLPEGLYYEQPNGIDISLMY